MGWGQEEGEERRFRVCKNAPARLTPWTPWGRGEGDFKLTLAVILYFLSGEPEEMGFNLQLPCFYVQLVVNACAIRQETMTCTLRAAAPVLPMH
jgi:hypothetical protein